MRLPRRVPWASIDELEQVCAWIYEDEHDLETKVLAVNRLAAWKAITSLPHALESAHAILSVILQDKNQAGSSTHLSLRQSYAAAVIRLVNGLVDPLQLGAYARSIMSIAAQLGLPAWLVELRHSATHEDLPSLELLRDAAREALTWLLHNYFLPTLNPTIPATTARAPLRPFSPLLMQYKGLLKATTRDVSLASKYSAQITRSLREIERWVGEAKVSASGLEWDDNAEGDGRERWALERLCDALLEKGVLVPVSRRKRALATGSFVPTASNLRIWTPLLTHLESLHSSFPCVLVFRITAHLLSRSENLTTDGASETMLFSAEEHRQDISFDRCLAGWANWLVDRWGDGEDANEDSGADLQREDVVVTIVTALGPTKEHTGKENRTVFDLLGALCRGRPNLEKAYSLMSAALPKSPETIAWNEDDIRLMHERLALLRAQAGPSPDDSCSTPVEDSVNAPAPFAGVPGVSRTQLQLPQGWRKIGPNDGWKPSPIGVFVGCSLGV